MEVLEKLRYEILHFKIFWNSSIYLKQLLLIKFIMWLIMIVHICWWKIKITLCNLHQFKVQENKLVKTAKLVTYKCKGHIHKLTEWRYPNLFNWHFCHHVSIRVWRLHWYVNSICPIKCKNLIYNVICSNWDFALGAGIPCIENLFQGCFFRLCSATPLDQIFISFYFLHSFVGQVLHYNYYVLINCNTYIF